MLDSIGPRMTAESEPLVRKSVKESSPARVAISSREVHPSTTSTTVAKGMYDRDF